jgi:hypothetical protein
MRHCLYCWSRRSLAGQIAILIVDEALVLTVAAGACRPGASLSSYGEVCRSLPTSTLVPLPRKSSAA